MEIPRLDDPRVNLSVSIGDYKTEVKIIPKQMKESETIDLLLDLEHRTFSDRSVGSFEYDEKAGWKFKASAIWSTQHLDLVQEALEHSRLIIVILNTSLPFDKVENTLLSVYKDEKV